MTNMSPAVEFHKVTKVYKGRNKNIQALNNMTFQLQADAIHVLLGPNGAGKTTSLEMIVGLRHPGSGTIRTLGLDPTTNNNELRYRVALQPQEVAVFEYLRVGEILDMWESLYDTPHSRDEILDSLDLTHLLDRQITKLSGGQKQRLNVALAMTSNAELLLLDEPSTGLDPLAQERLWKTLKKWREQGKTIVLSTHSMEEAHALADTILIINQGSCIDHDTPAALIERYSGTPAITFQITNPLIEKIRTQLESIGNLSVSETETYILHTSDTDHALLLLTKGEATNIHIHQPSLSDAYKAATGTDLITYGE